MNLTTASKFCLLSFVDGDASGSPEPTEKSPSNCRRIMSSINFSPNIGKRGRPAQAACGPDFRDRKSAEANRLPMYSKENRPETQRNAGDRAQPSLARQGFGASEARMGGAARKLGLGAPGRSGLRAPPKRGGGRSPGAAIVSRNPGGNPPLRRARCVVSCPKQTKLAARPTRLPARGACRKGRANPGCRAPDSWPAHLNSHCKIHSPRRFKQICPEDSRRRRHPSRIDRQGPPDPNRFASLRPAFASACPGAPSGRQTHPGRRAPWAASHAFGNPRFG